MSTVSGLLCQGLFEQELMDVVAKYPLTPVLILHNKKTKVESTIPTATSKVIPPNYYLFVYTDDDFQQLELIKRSSSKLTLQ